MPNPIRRVVTGHDRKGKSIVLMDGPAPHVIDRGPGRPSVTELWQTRSTPADNTGHEDAGNHPYRLPPPKHGTVFRIVEYPPDVLCVAAGGPEQAFDAAREGYARDPTNPRHPGFHKTASVDYAIVLSGQIYAMLDESEVLLTAGDVLIQRGTNHAWSNRSGEPATVAFVLIDAHPIDAQRT
jgi:mannose-6-phosphate isomerase-like protein (cupin superfamily)